MKKVTIQMPSALKKLTGGKTKLDVEATTVQDALDKLEHKFNGLKARLFDEEKNEIRRFIKIYVNSQDIKNSSGLDTELNEGDKISILSPLAGG